MSAQTQRGHREETIVWILLFYFRLLIEVHVELLLWFLLVIERCVLRTRKVKEHINIGAPSIHQWG